MLCAFSMFKSTSGRNKIRRAARRNSLEKQFSSCLEVMQNSVTFPSIRAAVQTLLNAGILH